MVAGKLEKFQDEIDYDEFITEGEPDEFLMMRDDDYPEPDIPISVTYKQMITTDHRCDYLCGSKGLDEDMGRVANTDVISTSNSPIDYSIGVKKPDEEVKEDKRDTISFMNVKTIEEGEEWYKQNFPGVPDELYPIMARWNWGDLSEITKKDIKNDKKRIKHGKKPKKPLVLERKVGKFIVEF